jgi:hypothetical protein
MSRWRYVCPECGAHRGCIRYRLTSTPQYYCRSCETETDVLFDKKRDTTVSQQSAHDHTTI